MLITFRLTWDPLDLVPCYISLRTMKQWSRWSSKEEVLQWDTGQETTGLLWIGCLIELIWIPRFKLGTSTPNTNSQTCWPKVISNVTNGTIFFICSTSAISPLSALRVSAWLAAPEEDAITKRRRRQDCGKIKADGDEPGDPSDCVEKPRDTQSIYRETWRKGKKKIQNPTQRRVLKEGCKMHTLAGWCLKLRWNLPRQIKSQESWDFSESESWSNHDRDVTGNLLHPEIQKIQGTPKLEAKNGHNIFICHQQLYLTWRRSIRSYDKFTAEVRRMTSMTSTWTQNEEDWWTLHFN